VASQRGDEIVQEGATPEGEALQWIFSDVTSESFNWRSQLQRADGWHVRERMVVRRH
jgi:hypothetical protein